MKRCPECLGKGEIICPVCQGTGKDPRNREKLCGYCGGSKHVRCPVCMGVGKLDDKDDYHP